MVEINLEGRVTLVTGGSRGIGEAIALLFARAGSDIVVNYRSDSKSAERVAAQVEELGRKALAVQADVAVKSDVDAMVDKAVKTFAHIDILINNAGIWEHNPIDGITEKSLRRSIDTNLMGCFYTTMAVVPHMKKQKSGNIVYISSTAGQRGEAEYSPYAATKGALISLTKSLGPELVQHNIRVNCVAPGWAITDMSRESLDGPDATEITGKIPMGRPAEPIEMANAVLFVASDMATFMTGEIVNVNGGAVLCG